MMGVDKSQNPEIDFDTSNNIKMVAPTFDRVNGNDLSTQSESSSIISAESVQNLSIVSAKLINVDNFLKDSLVLDKVQQGIEREKEEQDARDLKEDNVEDTPKNKFKLPGRKFLNKAKDWIMNLLFGWLVLQLINFLPQLAKILPAIGKAVDFLFEWGGKILNALVTVVDWGYKAYDWTRGKIGDLFGEKGLEIFDSTMKSFNILINAIGAMAIGFGAMALFFGGLWKGAGAAGATKAAAAAGGAKAAGVTGAAKTFAVGSAKVGVAGATGIVSGAGLLASGLGEGAFQLNKWGMEREKNWKKKAKDKWWSDPRKYFWAAAAGIMTILNRVFGLFGNILDVVGTPFRYLIELIRWPFLSKEGKEKQKKNMAKFDARIREGFRKTFNALDFMSIISDDKGSWGSLYGEKGTDAMGYTKDGKNLAEQNRKKEVLTEGKNQWWDFMDVFPNKEEKTNEVDSISEFPSYDEKEVVVSFVTLPPQVIPVTSQQSGGDIPLDFSQATGDNPYESLYAGGLYG